MSTTIDARWWTSHNATCSFALPLNLAEALFSFLLTASATSATVIHSCESISQAGDSNGAGTRAKGEAIRVSVWEMVLFRGLALPSLCWPGTIRQPCFVNSAAARADFKGHPRQPRLCPEGLRRARVGPSATAV